MNSIHNRINQQAVYIDTSGREHKSLEEAYESQLMIELDQFSEELVDIVATQKDSVKAIFRQYEDLIMEMLC